jgi:glyceraldehyde-3-phosphate dehydrogenase/erythrose-4-phosphate dehydrogenase
MAVRVAINGFGRIGRLAFRQMFDAEGYEVVAINDLTSPKMLAHLLKYDSSQGVYKYASTVEAGEDSITVNGKTITIYKEADASKLPWGELKVDVVLECTGFYTSKEKASAHITAGARKVVISAPAGNDLPTIVYNVNHKTLKPEDTVISAASCTTNCLAPMAKALNDCRPIMSGIMTTVHAYTGDQMILDGPQRKGDLRRRSTSGNDRCGKPRKIHGAVEKCRSEGHPGGGKCSYGEDDGAGRSRRRSGGRHGERRTYRFYHNHGTGAAGGGCGVYPGDRGRRYRRWQRNGSGLHAGS